VIAEVRRNGATVTLIAEGHIDGSNASVFQNALSSAIEKTDLTVIVDFDRVSFISSAGLRTLLMASKDLQRRGARLCLCSMQSRHRRKGKSQWCGWPIGVSMYRFVMLLRKS